MLVGCLLALITRRACSKSNLSASAAKYDFDFLCYLMFLGPWDQGGEWSDSGLNGVVRWMNRLYEIVLRDMAMLGKSTPNIESEQSLDILNSD